MRGTACMPWPSGCVVGRQRYRYITHIVTIASCMLIFPGQKKGSKTPTQQHQHHNQQHPTDHREHRTVALLRAYSTLLNNGSRFWYYLPLHRTQGPGAHADLSDIPRSFCHLVHSSLLSRLLSLSRAASLNDGEKHSSSYSPSIAGWIVQQQ
jgi:hypothetical protein